MKKTNLHPRNPHNAPYDFAKLTTLEPELEAFTQLTPRQDVSMDFSNPQAVKLLNKALLKQFYGVEFWDIPEGYLCPAIPGRADYIHYIADLLAKKNGGKVPKGKKVSVLDIGTGASCVYPIIGSQSYGWSFVGSDINLISVNTSEQIVKMNRNLSAKIRCRLQKDSDAIFRNIIKADEKFDLTLCNPPFHMSANEANRGTQRKVRNLSKGKGQPGKSVSPYPPQKPTLNFGGQNAELWCDGGEIAFLGKMIDESAQFSGQCLWFTSLVSKKDNLPKLYQRLKKVKVCQVKTLNMSQGNKISRILAWSFLSPDEHAAWAEFYWSGR
ncbi:23S rRNA (adenine(1618)-N(6))-methyltransferase RlmF [Oceanospirillum beijerinckii]|uniref:23S rRNA (adenine(1618)-N(6))-methyltransferase RlmF n=1 Tax=Oceanospirillum beijerinckii TaxID=64976 RepID=UPI00041210CF|nr:23S rRNA (adenine(1618)-N(6))-methyltransferase RlmF [Oceanospirillum beijerinckii]